MSVNPETRGDGLRAGVTSGRPEASAAIWSWRGARAARPVHTRGQAIRKALIGVAVAGVAALVLWLALGRQGFAAVVAGIATSLFLLAAIAPAGFFAVHFKVEAFARWVDEHDRFELATPAPLNLVCFRHVAGDAFNERLLEQVNRSGDLYMTHTKLNDVYTLRFSVGQTSTEAHHVHEAWRHIQQVASELESHARTHTTEV